jgi:hypothetical protein
MVVYLLHSSAACASARRTDQERCEEFDGGSSDYFLKMLARVLTEIKRSRINSAGTGGRLVLTCCIATPNTRGKNCDVLAGLRM